MSQTLGIDFAWARPSPRAVAAAGYVFVMGYLSGGGTKDLTAASIASYRGAGLQVGLVWETTANRALSGAAGGAVDGAKAEAQANAVGYPTGCVIFAAVDFDASIAQIDGPIRDYMLAFSAATVRPVGVYGSFDVVSRLCTPGQPPIGYAWQTMAWSGGRLWQPGHLFQRLSHTWSIAGVAVTDWDENVLLNPLPLFGAALTQGDDMAAVPQSEWNLVKTQIQDIVNVLSNAYDPTTGDDIGKKVSRLSVDLAPIERYVLDDKGNQVLNPDGSPQVSRTTIRQELANLTAAVGGISAQALADAIVAKLPAAQAQQVADLVIAQLGQRINTPPASS